MRCLIIPFGECSVPVPPDVGGRYVHRSVAVAVFPGGLMEAVATCTARWRLPCAPHDAGGRLDAATPGGRHVHRSEAVAVGVAVTPGQRPLVGVLWSVEIS